MLRTLHPHPNPLPEGEGGLHRTNVIWSLVKNATTVSMLTLFVIHSAHATESFDPPAIELSSSVTLDFSGDTRDSHDVALDIDLGLLSGNRLRAGIGKASVEGDSSAYTSNTARIGLNSDPLSKFSYGLSYEWLDRNDNIAADTVRGNLSLRMNDWRGALYPELRYITLTGTNNNSNLHVGIRNPGAGVGVAWTGIENWSFGFKHYRYDFSTDTQTLNRLSLLSERVTLRIGQAFDDRRTQIYVDRDLPWGGIGMEWVNSTSAIDQTQTRITTLNGFIDLSRTWSIAARAGRISSEGTDDIGYAGIASTWFW